MIINNSFLLSIIMKMLLYLVFSSTRSKHGLILKAVSK